MINIHGLARLGAMLRITELQTELDELRAIVRAPAKTGKASYRTTKLPKALRPFAPQTVQKQHTKRARINSVKDAKKTAPSSPLKGRTLSPAHRNAIKRGIRAAKRRANATALANAQGRT